MATPETIGEAIEQNAKGPQSATNGAQSASQHSLRDQIEADRYLRSKAVAATPPAFLGMRIQRIKPPGGG